MPGQAVHLAFARDIVRACGDARPSFDPEDGSDRQAFFAGALGPDMGYFPGGDKRLADLAHYVLTGHFARSLLELAGGGRTAAFAWGWASHILADVYVHPLINRASGELLNGSGGAP